MDELKIFTGARKKTRLPDSHTRKRDRSRRRSSIKRRDVTSAAAAVTSVSASASSTSLSQANKTNGFTQEIGAVKAPREDELSIVDKILGSEPQSPRSPRTIPAQQDPPLLMPRQQNPLPPLKPTKDAAQNFDQLLSLSNEQGGFSVDLRKSAADLVSLTR